MRSLTRLFTGAQPILLAAGLAGGCLDRGKRSEVVFPPGGMALDSAGSERRVYSTDSLRPVVQVGGASDQDTTLINPYIMASDEGGVYLFEADNRIVRFDTTGTRRWVQGRDGGGPGEYRNPRDMEIGPDRGVWLVDPESGRVTVVDAEQGRVRAMFTMRVAYSALITPLHGGFALYPSDLARDIFYFNERGDTVGTDTIPWSGFRQLEYLARGLHAAVDPQTGRWVLGFMYGNGWFAFDSAGRGSSRRYYVEPTRFPPVLKEHFADGSIGTKLVRTAGSALDMDLRGDTVFVLFDGQEPDRRRKLDSYSWQTGNYLGSILLPEPADEIGLCGRYLAVFSSRPVPKLTFYVRERKPDMK